MLKVVIHLLAILPLLTLYHSAFNDQLGADPVDAVIHFTGIGALNLLCITLLVTPVAKYFKQGFLLKTRRLLGLYAFLYALLHLLNFLFFEVQFDVILFFSEVVERPYITIGMLAFILLFALAITSLPWLKRSMGKTWQRLHNTSYLAIILVVIHFYWSVKSDVIEPLLYAGIACFLLGLRREKIAQWFK